MPADLYLILGVTPDASEEEIRVAWRRQVRYWHPDRNNDPRAARRIQLLNHAYDVLSDPTQRSTYDARRAQDDAGAADDYDVEHAVTYEPTTQQPAPHAPSSTQTTTAAAKGAAVVLLQRLEPLIAEANLLLSRPSDPPADVVDLWAASVTALVEQRLGFWHTYAQHLRMALGPGDPLLRLSRAQSVLASIRSDGIAGNIRPDV